MKKQQEQWAEALIRLIRIDGQTRASGEAAA
jgi:hypothetical protein